MADVKTKMEFLLLTCSLGNDSWSYCLRILQDIVGHTDTVHMECVNGGEKWLNFGENDHSTLFVGCSISGSQFYVTQVYYTMNTSLLQTTKL